MTRVWVWADRDIIGQAERAGLQLGSGAAQAKAGEITQVSSDDSPRRIIIVLRPAERGQAGRVSLLFVLGNNSRFVRWPSHSQLTRTLTRTCPHTAWRTSVLCRCAVVVEGILVPSKLRDESAMPRDAAVVVGSRTVEESHGQKLE